MAKTRTRRLAAREVAAGTKVILPVWHGIDEAYLLRRSPTLADRLGASTSKGVADVAAKVASALERADQRAKHAREQQTIVQAVGADEYDGLAFIRGVPTTLEERSALIAARPQCWETVLYAGYLLLGRDGLESKWYDYELGIPGGPRRDFDSGAMALACVRREVAWLSGQLEARMRFFEGPMKDRAFGPRGAPGDPERIAHAAKLIVETYELLLDWSASVRNISAPDPCADAIALGARMAEHPISRYATTSTSAYLRWPASRNSFANTARPGHRSKSDSFWSCLLIRKSSKRSRPPSDERKKAR